MLPSCSDWWDALSIYSPPILISGSVFLSFTELSQLAASLALGCDSSDSASLSHIRLLLLDRNPPVGSISPATPEQAAQNDDGEGLEMADGTQSALRLFHGATGVLVLLAITASVSE